MSYELDQFDDKYNSPEKVAFSQREVDELERVGKKISFFKDVKALYKYMMDPGVQWYRKSIVVGALIYFISPIDAIPDLSPLVGYLDDLGVITAVLKFLGSEIIPYYE